MERNQRKTTVTTRNNSQLPPALQLRPRIRILSVHPPMLDQIDTRSDSGNKWDREDFIIILANTTTETNGTGRK
uniref:Uncharacterized protein n=1 Tax=Caenorhabditis japonica TaxID=281687 RepID=A0A8R1EWR2_CAEJA